MATLYRNIYLFFCSFHPVLLVMTDLVVAWLMLRPCAKQLLLRKNYSPSRASWAIKRRRSPLH